MKLTLLLAFLMLLPAIVGGRPLADAPPELQSLVEAELAFSRASEEEGMRDAFLANLAEGSVIFRPGPVNGREWMESWDGNTGTLAWTPEYAEVSVDGMMGYTTGPWGFWGPDRSQEPTQHGYYLSVWAKTDEGWRVLGDIGTVGPVPDSLAAGEISWPDKAAPALPEDLDPDAEYERLMKLDNELSILVYENGAEAFFERIVDDVVILRLNQPLINGLTAARETLAHPEDFPFMVAEGGEVGAAGDFGFTYGRIHSQERALGKATEPEGSYLRVWRRDAAGTWRVAAEVVITNARG